MLCSATLFVGVSFGRYSFGFLGLYVYLCPVVKCAV